MINVNVGKKKSAEQKLHFHRLWDVSEEKQPRGVKGPQSSASGRPGLEFWLCQRLTVSPRGSTSPSWKQVCVN